MCWDRDRIGKDYLGEFDVALEDIFNNGEIAQEVKFDGSNTYQFANFRQPQWYTLKSRQKSAKSKGSAISGEVQLQFAIADPANPSAAPQDILDRFMAFINASSVASAADDDEDTKGLRSGSGGGDGYNDDDDDDDEEKDLETDDETDDPVKSGGTEKRKKKLRLARMKKKTKARTYEFSGGTDVVGIVFLDIVKITDLPPERNSRFFTMSTSSLAHS